MIARCQRRQLQLRHRCNFVAALVFVLHIVMASGAHGSCGANAAAERSAGASPVTVATGPGELRNGNYTFEKLDGVSNFITWKHYIKHALILEDLWSCIESQDDIIDKSKDLRALARINLAVKSNCIQYIRQAKTAKEAWNKLVTTFEDSGFVRRVLLLRTLHRASYTDFNSMEPYIEHIMNLVQQLGDIGRAIEDAEVAELILSGLPPEFDIVVSSLEAVALSGDISSEKVRSRLIQEEHRRKRDTSRNDFALLSKQKKVLTCYHCGRPGHIKAKCFKLNKNKKQVACDKNNVASVAFLSGFNERQRNDWYLDSGASAHMCNNIKWFNNIVKCKKTVDAADGNPMECLGVGEVHIPMKNRTQIVNNTLYVPSLSTNLISVSKLSEKRFKTIFSDDKCKVFHNGKLIVSATGHNGIYRLDRVCVMSSYSQKQLCDVAMTDVEAEFE